MGWKVREAVELAGGRIPGFLLGLGLRGLDSANRVEKTIEGKEMDRGNGRRCGMRTGIVLQAVEDMKRDSGRETGIGMAVIREGMESREDTVGTLETREGMVERRMVDTAEEDMKTGTGIASETDTRGRGMSEQVRFLRVVRFG